MKPAIFRHRGLWWCIRQVSAYVVDTGAGDTPRAAFDSMNAPGEKTDISINNDRIARALRERFAATNPPAAPAPQESNTMFQFNVGQSVTITASGEQGEVIGRAEYATAENNYYIRYKCADGRAVEAWWTESALSA